MKELLAKLDQLIAAKPAAAAPVEKTEKMRPADFLKHVETETKKALEDDEEKREKRLKHLRDVVEQVVKAGAWEATEFRTIPLFQENTTAELTDTTTSVQVGNKGTAGDGNSFASNPGDVFKSLGDMFDGFLKGAIPSGTPGATQTVTDDSPWALDMANKEFMREGVHKRGGEWGADPKPAQK